MKKSNIILIIQAVVMSLIHLPLCIVMVLPNLTEDLTRVLLIVNIAVLVLMIPVCIVSLVFACSHFWRTQASPLKTAMIVKLCLIPWYISNFVICVLLVAGFLNPWLMMAIPLLVVCEVAVTFIFMLSTSIHSIAYTVRYLILHKTKPNGRIITALIFHLIFCLDVVGAIMLYAESKKSMQP